MPGPPTVYPGTNPVTISTSAGAAANGVVVNHGPYGVVARPLTVNGNNDITAGNIAAADQAEQDSITWLLWRIIDIANGGVYTFTAAIATSNDWTFNGHTTLSFTKIVDASSVTGGATLTIGDATDGDGSVKISAHGSLEVAQGGTVTGDAGSLWQLAGTAAHHTNINLIGDGTIATVALNLTAGATLNLDSTCAILSQGPIERAGTAAINRLRPESGTAPTVSTSPFDMSRADTWKIPTTHIADVTLTFGSGLTVGPCEATFYSPDQSAMSFDYILDFGFGEVFRFRQSQVAVASVTVRYTGAGGHFIIIGTGGTGFTTVDSGGIWG